MATRCYRVISLNAFSSSLEQHLARPHTNGHPQSLLTALHYTHLLTLLQKGICVTSPLPFFVWCLYVTYMLMNLEGLYELCARVCAWEKETGIRTDGGGEP